MKISLTHVILISLMLLIFKSAGFNIEYWVVALPVLVYMCVYLLVLAPAVFVVGIVGIIVVFIGAWIGVAIIVSIVVIVLFLIKEMWRKIRLKFKKK